MTVLLDTHVVLRWLSGDHELGPRARALLETSPTRYCSAASVWEMAFRRAAGRLTVEDGFEEQIPLLGMTHLPVDARHAAAVGSVALPHRDPFDELLVTQAQVEGVRFLTADRAILAAGLPFVVDARE